MSTPAQTLANQQNAQRSTGPTTPEGKAAASRNAATHGLHNADFTLLPHEDAAAFQSAQQSYRDRFTPQDHHELFLVHLAVQSTWKLARIHRLQAAVFNLALDPEIPAATPESAVAANMLKANPNAFQTLERYAIAAERSYHKAIRELEKIVATRPPPAPVRNEPICIRPPSPKAPQTPTHPPFPIPVPSPNAPAITFVDDSHEINR